MLKLPCSNCDQLTVMRRSTTRVAYEPLVVAGVDVLAWFLLH